VSALATPAVAVNADSKMRPKEAFRFLINLCPLAIGCGGSSHGFSEGPSESGAKALNCSNRECAIGCDFASSWKSNHKLEVIYGACKN
jgi:hypothetical protein